MRNLLEDMALDAGAQQDKKSGKNKLLAVVGVQVSKPTHAHIQLLEEIES